MRQMIIRGQAIIDFLEGRCSDHKGRKFAEILNWTDEELEQCHDQVQWTFPLHEESRHASTYPIVDKDVIEKASQSEVIKNNLRLAKDRFERFYGIGDYEDEAKQKRWCVNRDHNLLRITRIIRCLRLFGLEEEARDFYLKVEGVGSKLFISTATLDYWMRAMVEDVWEGLQ